MSKAIELQFHWVFLLIAGAIILGFFSIIALKQYQISTAKKEIFLLRDFETTFESSLKSENTVMPPLDTIQDVSFYCSNVCDCNYIIGKTQRPYREKIIISPPNLKGGKQIMWALPVNLPFKVSSILLLFNQNVKFYFIYDETSESVKLKEIIQRNIPETLISQFIQKPDLYNLQFEGYDYSRFVFIETSIQDIDNSFSNEDVSAVLINDNLAEFYEKQEGQAVFIRQKSFFFYPEDKGSLFAAIFSSDANMFSCSMQKIYSRLEAIANIHKSRIQELQGFEERCYYPLDNIARLEEISPELMQNNVNSFSQLPLIIESLKKENYNIADIQGCPSMY
ncbi:hypothetical protein HYV79_01030 [Candidatus Woesearchaeota archaeon]|nr:hypothetical protein [Candidatus Woesearchaeota archaeon]